jgi:leucyl aminopeptidase
MLLPSSRAPTIVHSRSRNADQLDVVLAIVALPVAAASWRQLPHSGRWQELHARAAARPGTVRSTLLGNRQHTLAILGYLKSDASAFERLSLAGRMLKEAGARNPQSVGLLGTGEQGFARSTLEALLAATLTRAFALPTFRAPERAERRMRRVVLLGSAGLDAHYDIASARGTNLARWLTALPPNVLDAAGYREALTRLARALAAAALAR